MERAWEGKEVSTEGCMEEDTWVEEEALAVEAGTVVEA